MFQRIGEEIISSEELIKKIESSTVFHIKNDLTASIGREDAIALRIACPVSSIPGLANTTNLSEEDINYAMNELDEYSHAQMKTIFFNCYSFMTFTYAYEETINELLFVFALMDRERGERKIKDVINRLLKF